MEGTIFIWPAYKRNGTPFYWSAFGNSGKAKCFDEALSQAREWIMNDYDPLNDNNKGESE